MEVFIFLWRRRFIVVVGVLFKFSSHSYEIRYGSFWMEVFILGLAGSPASHDGHANAAVMILSSLLRSLGGWKSD